VSVLVLVLVCDQLWRHFWHNDEHWSSHRWIFVFHNRSAATSNGDKWYSLQKFCESMYYVFLCYQSTHVLGSVQIYTDVSYAVPKMEMEYTEQYCGLLWMVGLLWGWIKGGLEIASQFKPFNITHPVLKLSGAGCCSLRHKDSRVQDPCSYLTHSPASSKFMEAASQQCYNLAHADDW